LTLDTADRWASGKGHRDENFPVASRLVAPRFRAPVMAFYRFARAADDVADHATLRADEKLRLLDRLEATLDGRAEEAAALPLRRALGDGGLPTVHARELLDAFRMDARGSRPASFEDLMDYCRLSAVPVGRFVLDVHGESRSTWARSDALCAALQINNHLQDCGADYRALGRVYVPTGLLEKEGARVEDLGAARSSPALRRVLVHLAERTGGLLRESAGFANTIADRRLRLEVAVIQRLAERIQGELTRRDPLAERVALGRAAVLGTTLRAVLGSLRARRVAP